MLRSIISFLLLLGSAAAGAGGIYKWVDENGAVHYRDTPPPSGGHYEVIPRPATGAGQDPTAVMEELRRRTEEADKARSDEEQRQQQRRQAQDMETVRAQSCQQARQNLEILARSQNVVKEIAGKREVVTPEQRQEEVQKNQKFLDENCKQP